MLAARVDGPGRVEVVEIPEPDVLPGTVVVRVGACGICGTDLHILDGELPSVRYPVVPGHEFAGVVAGVGAGVDEVREGDRVAVDPSLPCGTCRYCRVNRGNLCERWAATGVTVNGAFAELVRVPAARVYTVPDDMDLPAAALIEPVSCAVHGIDRLAPRPGETALIVGGGTMGVILAELMRHSGAGLVVICERRPERLERARAAGFEHVAEDLDTIAERFPGGFDNVIEVTGVTAVVERAALAVAPGGKLLIFGVTPAGETARFEPFAIYNRELTIIGSMAVLASFGRALELVAAGVVRADRIVTARYPLASFAEAVAAMRGGQGLKTQIEP